MGTGGRAIPSSSPRWAPILEAAKATPLDASSSCGARSLTVDAAASTLGVEGLRNWGCHVRPHWIVIALTAIISLRGAVAPSPASAAITPAALSAPTWVAEGSATTQATYDAVFGAGRLETAVEACKRAFPASGSAGTIVLATGWDWPDALGGSSLAGAYKGPLLLTRPDLLSQQVIDEARRLNVSRVVILGSGTAVSDAVETSLRSLDVNGHGVAVSRIGGADRFDTAAQVASAAVDVLRARGGTYDGTAFFATGDNFPDALAASPIATSKVWPILLVKSDAPSPRTEAAIAKLHVTRGIMLGSDKAVTTAVENRLKVLLPAPPGRLQGANRYLTGIQIARFGVASGLHWDGVALTTGTNYPDALAGGVMQGALGSVVLLTPGIYLDLDVAAELAADRTSVATVRYLGSTSALSQNVRREVAASLQGNPPTSATGAQAVWWAETALGKPYQWGAAGPYSFDCSGLTMWAYAHVGMSLPHHAADQIDCGAPIARADLQPGDLVFFGTPIHHCGMYVGGGSFIEAPYTGAVVRISSLSNRSDYAGACRPY